jgi:RNA polymerase sigma factor FliA
MAGFDEYAHTANQIARDELIVTHMWLVRHIAGKLAAQLPPDVDQENLESAAMLGLCEAADRFDPSRGVEFKAFAGLRIRGSIIDELRRNCPLPQEMLQKVQLVTKAQQVMTPPITVEKLQKETGLTEDEVIDCLAAVPLTQVKSFDQVGDGWFGRASEESPDDGLHLEDQKRLLAKSIEALPERERLVVTLYYMEDLRLKEIGQVLNLSESRVSRLLSGAQLQMREFVKTHL